MIFTRDNFQQIECPEVILCKANKERIGTIHTAGLPVYEHKFQDIDELSFTMNLIVDSEQNEYYSAVDVMKYVEFKDVGLFLITDVSIKNEGTELESKDITCKSYETTLAQKYLEEFYINTGETGAIDDVKFYDFVDTEHSLLHLCLEKCSEWIIGHVDPVLMTKQRSFEISREDVYSFFMNECSEAFECFFIFDSLNKTINVYDVANYGYDTNIFVSYDNLLKNTNMSCSTDDIKTCITVTGEDELTVREINLGFDRIYNFDYYNSTEFWSQGLYDAYNLWVVKRDAAIPTYEGYWQQYVNEIIQIDYLTTEMMPDDPTSKDWTEYGLTPLNEQLHKDETIQAQYMKAGWGNEWKDTEWGEKQHVPQYTTKYLPLIQEMQAIRSEIAVREGQINQHKTISDNYDRLMKQIQDELKMANNFTQEQLKELSAFIREDELNSAPFRVNDNDSEEDRYDTLQQMLDYAESELERVSTPQLSFSAELVNLFEIPEFDVYSGEFEVGNYIWVELRDNYRIKAKLLSIHYEFGNPGGFSVTFGNVIRTAKDVYTTIQDVMNKASSAATSVSFNASYWNESAKDTNNISKMIADGLLDAGNYISNGDNSELMIDSRGVFVTTKEGQYANKDSVFIGGGRILFTDDNWETVSEAIGRVTINGQSHFGVIAQIVAAGYIYGSVITGTKFNNGNGTFSVDENGNLVASNATITGTINAKTGRIGVHKDGTGGFIITEDAIYNTKASLSSNASGVYIGTDGIALGANNVFKVTSAGALSATNASITGSITAKSGRIGADQNGNGGFVIESNKIYNTKSSFDAQSNGVYIGTDGIAIGNNKFSVASNGTFYARGGTIENGRFLIVNNWDDYVYSLDINVQNGQFVQMNVTSQLDTDYHTVCIRPGEIVFDMQNTGMAHMSWSNVYNVYGFNIKNGHIVADLKPGYGDADSAGFYGELYADVIKGAHCSSDNIYFYSGGTYVPFSDSEYNTWTYKMAFQSDGNLVITDRAGNIKWHAW